MKKTKKEQIYPQIFEIIKEKRVVTTSEIASELKLSWNTAEKYLLELCLENKILRLKKSGVNLWVEK